MRSLVLAAFVSLAMIGCKAEDPADANKPADTNTSATASSTEEKGKCGMCGGEFAKAELTLHDGITVCETCMASHKHG